ncbi:hypothetical protein SAMN04488509_102625 [Aquimonas voraii]|uniref:Carboxypeptidase regulatory-like domain-containing protein n=1 Tax=Aquimonas voraii TaxID=265719 RepID=A0A1G6V386_9GAMM|nr:hypothetical protein SAMN04488509_102625 [Aquimonas voraii]
MTNAQVTLYDTSGGFVANAGTSTGQFELPGIRPGSYLLLADSPDHVREVYDNIPCPLPRATINCPGAIPLVFTRESSDREIEISLQPNPVVTGRIGLEGRSESGFAADLFAFGSNGQSTLRVLVQTDAQGSYRTQAFPSGSFRFGASMPGYWDQLFPRIDCLASWPDSFSGCSLSNATVINLQPGQANQDIDFRLRPQSASAVRVVSASNHAPLAGVSIDVWNGNGVRLQSLLSSPEGMVYVEYDPLQTRLLSTFNLLGLEDQVYNGIRCPAGPVYFGQCSLQGATPLPSPINGSTLAPDIVIRMSDGIMLFSHGFEP